MNVPNVILHSSQMLIFFTGLVFWVVDRSINNTDNNLENAAFGYNLSEFNEKYVLEKELREISGLSYYGKNQLACIQDEKGEVYIYDLKEKKIARKIKFGKKGDYEGVEIVGKEVFAVRSDGKLFNFSLTDADEEVKPITWDTPLSSENDVEGLGYLKKEKQLLLACKEKSKIGGRKSKGKAIYRFDLKQKELLPNPFVDINVDELNDFLKAQKKDYKKIKEFKPSAVAIHPKTRQTFIVASVGKVLIVLSKSRVLEHVIPLSPKKFKQPEGICFAPDGTLYISNEGGEGKGYILAFFHR